MLAFGDPSPFCTDIERGGVEITPTYLTFADG